LNDVITAFAGANWQDGLALVVFFGCWIGYWFFADSGQTGSRGLIGVTHEYRLKWATETSTRDIPVADASLVGNLMKSVSFYASTTIYIIAGLVALMGTIDKLELFAADLPFASTSSRLLIEMKILLLIVVFIVAYFKFTWSLRISRILGIIV